MKFWQMIFIFAWFLGQSSLVYSQETVDGNLLSIEDINLIRDPFVSLIEPETNPIDQTTAEVIPPTPIIRTQVVESPVSSPLPDLTSSEVQPVEENFDFSKLRIRGLIWDTNNPQAIINEMVVHVGDIVSEVKVVSITKEGAMVMHNNQTALLSIPTEPSVVISTQQSALDARRNGNEKR